jgi:glycosyltransferase involved in cell wall biosynthesis
MKRTLLVDPAPSGHRAFYLALIAAALGPESVYLLVPAGHFHLEDCFKRRGLALADFAHTVVEDCAQGALMSHISMIAREQSCERIFFAFLDSCIEPLLTGSERFSCPVSGIWFHPYALDPRYRWLPPLDKRLRHRRSVHHGLRRLRDGLTIERLFFLDPLAAANLRWVNPSIRSAVLPDPWEKTPDLDRDAARARFHLPQDRVIFLHIGSSEKRKGLADTLAAFDRLAADPSLNQRILLLRVGENDRLGPGQRQLLESLATRGMVKTVEGFVPESDFIEYFSAADWILLPYRNFRHSSGILSHALAANRPVIAADYGMIAKTVRDGDLGVLFRHRSQAALSCIIRQSAMSQVTVSVNRGRDRLDPNVFCRQLAMCMEPDTDSTDTGDAAEGVSVVICCHNSAERLPETLRHLSLQTLPSGCRWEVLVVDNASHDDTALVASRLWEDLGLPAPLTVVHEPTPGLSSARNAGIRAACYEYLVLCDDDNWLAPDYLEKVHQTLSSDPSIGCLGGRNLPHAAIRLPEWFQSVQEMYAVGPQGAASGDISARKFVFGAGMALRKSTWNRLIRKGYKSFLNDRTGKSLSSGGDAEICAWHLLEGKRLHYDENLSLTHFIPQERLDPGYAECLRNGMILSNGVLRMYHSLLERPPDMRSTADWFRSATQLLSALAILPFKRSAGIRKLAKSQALMGTWLKIHPSFHSILAYYAAIVPERTWTKTQRKMNS